MKSPLDAGDVWSGQTKVPAQEVHNSWSDHLILLKFLLEFLEAVFLGIAQKLLVDTPSLLSGHTKDQTRVPAQEVHNSWSDRLIVLEFLQEFLEVVFIGIAMKSLLDGRNILLG
jgi:hypothetical protein